MQAGEANYAPQTVVRLAHFTTVFSAPLSPLLQALGQNRDIYLDINKFVKDPKPYFDFIRNTLICGVLLFIAQRLMNKTNFYEFNIEPLPFYEAFSYQLGAMGILIIILVLGIWNCLYLTTTIYKGKSNIISIFLFIPILCVVTLFFYVVLVANFWHLYTPDYRSGEYLDGQNEEDIFLKGMLEKYVSVLCASGPLSETGRPSPQCPEVVYSSMKACPIDKLKKARYNGSMEEIKVESTEYAKCVHFNFLINSGVSKDAVTNCGMDVKSFRPAQSSLTNQVNGTP